MARHADAAPWGGLLGQVVDLRAQFYKNPIFPYPLLTKGGV